MGDATLEAIFRLARSWEIPGWIVTLQDIRDLPEVPR